MHIYIVIDGTGSNFSDNHDEKKKHRFVIALQEIDFTKKEKYIGDDFYRRTLVFSFLRELKHLLSTSFIVDVLRELKSQKRKPTGKSILKFF